MTSVMGTLFSTGSVASGATGGTGFCVLSHSTQLTQPGQYRIYATGALGSGSTAADDSNICVYVGASVDARIPVVHGSIAASPLIPLLVTLDGATDVQLVVYTGTSASTYYGWLYADYLGRQGRVR